MQVYPLPQCVDICNPIHYYLVVFSLLAAAMASSRVFIKNLPPTISEDDFKKHFSATSAITDAKLIPHRRIGYIGYKTPEDAAKAVKYFNRSFIRMSKIAVEIARPVCTCPARASTHYRTLLTVDRYQIRICRCRERPNESRSEKMLKPTVGSNWLLQRKSSMLQRRGSGAMSMKRTPNCRSFWRSCSLLLK